MNKKNEALGKGIRALLESIETEDERDLSVNEGLESSGLQIYNIPLDKIEVNPFQPRAEFDDVALKELTSSIQTVGLIQPVTVRKLESNKFQLIVGERRLRASKLAGEETIKAFIRQANDQEMLELGLIENIQREELNAMEIAVNYNRLIDECGLKQEKLAERVGKERSTVANYLRLLKLPPDIQRAIKEKKLSMGHARALISIENVDVQ
ncbi:MAG: ParB/RepB/Spo0J family partition protein, partial [Bacteroidetes bacterium]|nr:ParB/RepB/Spo0J family partition protein [Bacteroidota bacterium]